MVLTHTSFSHNEWNLFTIFLFMKILNCFKRSYVTKDVEFHEKMFYSLSKNELILCHFQNKGHNIVAIMKKVVELIHATSTYLKQN